MSKTMADLTIQSFENPVPLPGMTGGQGVLYLARYQGTTEVVLKVMSVSPENAVRAFKTLSERTAQLMALEHPGVVRYVGCFQDKSQFSIQHFVVTEHLRGETLKQYLMRESAGVGSIETLRLALTCLRTLADLAAAGVLHRDLTPSNIFLESITPSVLRTARYKLIDFEVGKFIDPSSSGNTTTTVGVGKQDYMAPELFRSLRASERSDIFTFALTLHEALTGKLPYKRGTLKQANEEIRPSPCVNQLIPGLGDILERCLARTPTERPGSFSELLASIQPLIPGELSGTPPRRYRLLTLVGEGGFGQVYKADEVGQEDSFVAVKHLTQARYADRFEREAKTLQQFNDPRIVRFVDYFQITRSFGDDRFLVMQFLEQMPGSSLRERIKAVRAAANGAHVGLKPEEVIVAFIRYAEGLACLHAVDVFHRDIKPANLYLPDGRPERACIMDLGIVRNEDATHTQGGGVPGSPDYMAPEFVNASGGRGSSASDVYALGLCLFEALTGRYLFGRHSKKDEVWNNFFTRATQRPDPNFAPLERVAPRYVSIVSRMTVYDVDDRIGVKEVARVLQELATSETKEAHAESAAGTQNQRPSNEPRPAAHRVEESDAPTMTQPAAAELTAATAAAQFPQDATSATIAAQFPQDATLATEALSDSNAGKPGDKPVPAQEPEATLATVAASETALPKPVPEKPKPAVPAPKAAPRGPGRAEIAMKKLAGRLATFPFALWAKRAAVFLILAGAVYAVAVYVPPAFRDYQQRSAERRERGAYDAAIADIQKTADELTAVVGGTPTPVAFAPIPAALLAAQSNLAASVVAVSPNIRNMEQELQISNLLTKAVADYASILDRQARALVDDCVAAFQRGDGASADAQAEVWQTWKPLLAPAIVEVQADQIASAKNEYKKAIARREQMARDAELARLSEPMSIRFNVAEDAASDPSFKREYETTGGRWLLATDSLKLPPGAARFRFSRADYEPIIQEATVEPQKPLSVMCSGEWTPTESHTRFLALRKALTKLRAADATSSDLEAAVKLVGGSAPVLADAARKQEWDNSAAEVKQTEHEYLVALEEHRIIEAFVKELNTLAADPAKLSASRLEFPDEDILGRPEVKKAATGLIASVTNHVVTALVDEPLNTRADRIAKMTAFLHSSEVARVIGIADESASKATDAAQRTIDAAGQAVFVRVWNRAEGELSVENGGLGAWMGERVEAGADIAVGKSGVMKLAGAGNVRFEASAGEDYLPAVKTVEAGKPGIYEVTFTQPDFKMRPAGITLAAGDAPGVSMTLVDASGKTLATAPGTLEVPPGTYSVRFIRPDHVTQAQTVTVAPRKMLTLLPELWHHEITKLVLSQGGVEGVEDDVRVTLVSVETKRPIDVQFGENVVDTGRYTLTFSRTGGVDQSETINLVVGRDIEKRPGAWKPSEEYIGRLKERALDLRRAEIQKAAGIIVEGGAAGGTPDVPEWVARAVSTESLLGADEAQMLDKLQDIYLVMCDAPSQPLTTDKIEDWEQMLAAGYVPNAADVALVRRALAVWEAHNQTIQNAGGAPQRTKDAAVEAVERIRKLHAEFVRKTEKRQANEH